MFSVSHKTVFVVDHCPYMAESSRQQVECDVVTKSRAQGLIPLAPVSKSLWTCAVECSMEYCRILYDIYPRDKLVSLKTEKKRQLVSLLKKVTIGQEKKRCFPNTLLFWCFTD